MDSKRFKNAYADPTQEFTIQIPCRLVERINAYTSQNDSTITNVVIEALDIFLREQKNNPR